MQIKVRKVNSDGTVRLESTGEVKEIIVNEDIVHPNKESVSLCFRGKNSSGIVDLTPKEIDFLYEKIRSRMHLIKGLRTLSGGGARKL